MEGIELTDDGSRGMRVDGVACQCQYKEERYGQEKLITRMVPRCISLRSHMPERLRVEGVRVALWSEVVGGVQYEDGGWVEGRWMKGTDTIAWTSSTRGYRAWLDVQVRTAFFSFF